MIEIDNKPLMADHTIPKNNSDPLLNTLPDSPLSNNRQYKLQTNNRILLPPLDSARQYLCLYSDIHFQYNIIMQAIFIYSVYSMQQTNFLRGAFFYSVLINFKHIYIYAALAFFLFILK